jgi:hypothetical protein
MKKTAFEIEMRSLVDKVKGLMPTGTLMSDGARGYAQAIEDVLKIMRDEVRERKQESIEWAERPSHYNSDDLREDDR